jgi:hypothetical protein
VNFDCAEKEIQDEVLQDNEQHLKQGYLQMSRINLSLAEEAVTSDNDALSIAEQNLRSVKKR